MSIHTSARPAAPVTSAPLSTKIVVWIGVLLVGGGLALAAADHLRTTPDAATAPIAPPATTGFAVPASGHLLQFAGLLVAGVCIAGFLVVTRSATRRR